MGHLVASLAELPERVGWLVTAAGQGVVDGGQVCVEL
jgi:hypothetical protein